MLRRLPGLPLVTIACAIAAGCARAPVPALAPAASAAPSAPPAPALPAVLDLARALTAAVPSAAPLAARGFTDPAFWQPGRLEAWIDGLATASEDLDASGQWHAAYPDPVPYRRTLGGTPVASYDPTGFLAGCGLPATVATGRGDVDLFHAWKLTNYKPNPRYLPGPPGLATAVQKLLLAGARVTPGAIKGFDGLIDRTVMRKLEKVDRLDPNPYGRDEDVVVGPVANLPAAHRYAGALARVSRQHAWDSGFHEGGPAPTADRPTERFGTYEIALAVGFTPAQALRIASQDLAVDLNQTHYRGPDGQPRKTASGTGGANGDLHWHYNRAAAGQEDTRIAGARVHLERALRFAHAGRFDDAEQELGIGLHGLQDMSAHAQITPFNHALLGEFPDIQADNPVGVFEAATVTEGYMRQYLAALVPAPAAPAAPAPRPHPTAAAMAQALVGGDAEGDARAEVAGVMAQLPEGLLGTLYDGGVTIFVAAPGTTPLAVGFGTDLDGDGVVTPGRWVDLDGDGVQQPWEVEGRLPDGRDWASLPAAYDGNARRIYLSASLVGALDAPLRHELAHALDDLWLASTTLGPRWREARERQLRIARRAEEAAFTDADREEFIARRIGT